MMRFHGDIPLFARAMTSVINLTANVGVIIGPIVVYYAFVGATATKSPANRFALLGHVTIYWPIGSSCAVCLALIS